MKKLLMRRRILIVNLGLMKLLMGRKVVETMSGNGITPILDKERLGGRKKSL